MSRLQSIVKGGYYPLNPEWVPHLANLFVPSKNFGRILDPFAGEGAAIETLGAALNLEPHAIEIDIPRGREVQKRFGVIRGITDDAYEVTISSGAFPLIYLNPPYDSDPTSYELRRAEYRALSHFWKYLQFDGLMVWVVYAQQLSKTVARSFFKNCNRVDIFRFPDLHLDAYTQIAVIGRRHNDKRVPNEVWIDQTAEKFAALAKTPEKIRDITLGVKPPKGAPEDYDPRFVIPPTRDVKFFQFVPRKVDPDAMLKLYTEFGPQHLAAFKKVVDVPRELPPITPIAKPRFGQLAVVMASGMIDGIQIEHGGKQMLLRGSVKRVSTKVREDEDEDSHGNPIKKEVFHDAPQSQIVMLSEAGEVHNISDDQVLVEFIQQHRDELMDYFERNYKPAYDMTIDDVWAEIYDTLKVKGEFDLLPTQEYVTTAMIEHLLRKRFLIVVGEPSVGKTAITITAIAALKLAEQLKKTDKARLAKIAKRYKIPVDKLDGLHPGEVVIVLCPANMPSKWVREIEQMYPEARAERLQSVLQVHKFFDAAEADVNHIHIGVITYEDAKLGETWEAAYNVRRSNRKVPVYDEAANQLVNKIVTIRLPLDPTTGTPITMRAMGEIIPMPEKKLEGRQNFLEGEGEMGVFEGYRWRVHDDGTKVRVPVYRVVSTRDGLALWQQKRMYGLPKIGNGRVEFEWEEVQGRSPKHTIRRKKFIRNLWPDEPIHDEWLAMQGIRCYDSSSRKSHIEKYMQNKKLEVYRKGDGDRKLDEMLTKAGVTVYRTGDGVRIPRNPRYPLADYIARRYKGRIGLLVCDELHKTKAIDTDIGVAARRLAQVARKVVGLTGTLYGGVASSLYTIEFTFNERVREAYPWMRGTPMHWITQMGVVEDVFETKATYTNGQYTGTKRFQAVRAKEIPGCSPIMVRELLDHTLFVGLKDLGNAMPEFNEMPVEVPMDAMMGSTYSHVRHVIKDYNAGCVVRGDKSFVGSMFQNLLSLPDSFHRENEVWHRKVVDRDSRRPEYSKHLVMTTPSLGDYIKPKEQRLADRVREIIAAGERAIIFVNQSATRDIQDHIADVVIKPLVPEARTFVLRSTIEPDRRVEVIDKQVEEGMNVLICNPKLVAEGVDLVQFNRTIFLEINHSLAVMGQASRRTWRLNQKSKEVSVEYFVYDDEYQNASLYAIADKTNAANILYGNEGGSLSALSENQTIYQILAQVVKEGVKFTKEEIAAKFNQAAYTDQDFLESSWYAPPRIKKAAGETPEPAQEVEPDEPFTLDLGLFEVEL